MHAHLKRVVVLPHPEDYALLTFVAAVSYVQQIFDAVPLVLIVGAAGSGKTDLARALAQVGSNATIITGQTSAATAARVLDQLSGLAVFDDLEQIGQRSAGDDFSEFVQQLKVSYKKDTARKAWTNTKTMRVETLDFYGVKVITNTTGAGEILSSRMLKVFTRKLPPEVLGEREHMEPTSGAELQALRDGLHLWAMEQVRAIETLYRRSYAAHTGRQQEIEAPLRVLAELFGHAELRADLEQALRLQSRVEAEVESASSLLKLAAQELVRQGYWDRVSVKQLILQMRLLVGEDWGKRSTTEIPEWHEPRWVGKVLRVEYIVDPRDKDERPRLWGEQTRVYPLDSAFVADTLNMLREAGIPHAEKVRQPLEFCESQPCPECPYASFCDMLPIKQEHLRRKGKRPQA